MIEEKLISINNINISVKTTGNSKNAILFIHGSSQTADTWLPQLENKTLSEKYHLIAFDLPGHGKSGWFKSNPEKYRPAYLASLIKAIMEELHAEKYILVGLSYGTTIIGEIKMPLPNCKGIVLLSPCIVNDVIQASDFLTPGLNGHVISAENPSDEELKAFAFEHVHNKKAALRFIDTYGKTDPVFREQLAQALLENELTDELLNIKKQNVPICVIFGKDETLIKNNYLDNYKPLWKEKVFLIEHAGHLVNEENPESFNDLLLCFADEAFK